MVITNLLIDKLSVSALVDLRRTRSHCKGSRGEGRGRSVLWSQGCSQLNNKNDTNCYMIDRHLPTNCWLGHERVGEDSSCIQMLVGNSSTNLSIFCCSFCLPHNGQELREWIFAGFHIITLLHGAHSQSNIHLYDHGEAIIGCSIDSSDIPYLQDRSSSQYFFAFDRKMETVVRITHHFLFSTQLLFTGPIH
ncbi:hypothetical protein ACMFMF_005945 [Clarireedia jacksonii]